MNVEFGGEQHESAIAKVLKATKAAGKYASIIVGCASGMLTCVLLVVADLVVLNSA